METEQKIDETIVAICDVVLGLLNKPSTLVEITTATDATKALAELVSARAEMTNLPRKACE